MQTSEYTTNRVLEKYGLITPLISRGEMISVFVNAKQKVRTGDNRKTSNTSVNFFNTIYNGGNKRSSLRR